MYMLPPRPVSQRPRAAGSGSGEPSGSAEPFEFYLLELVDERYYWWAAGNKAAPDPTPGTWTAFITALFARLGVTPTFSGTIPSAYDPPDPDRWKVGFEPIPVQIDAACRTVGCRVVRTPGGAVSVVRWTQAKAALDANVTAYEADRTAGGRVSNLDIGRSVPASVCVVFGNDLLAANTSTLASLAGSGAVVGYGTSTVGVGGRTGLVKADISKDASGSARTGWAAEAAADYYRWQLADWEADYRGAVPWTPTGAEAHVEWRAVYTGADEPLLTTHVRRPPPFDPNIYGGAGLGDGGSGLSVCGSPIPLADCDPCDLTDADLEVFVEINGVLLDPCDFEVTETEACGGGGGFASGSGSSGSGGSSRAVRIKLKGKTENVAVGKGDPVLCDNCDIVETIRVLCFRNGLYTGTRTSPWSAPASAGAAAGWGVVARPCCDPCCTGPATLYLRVVGGCACVDGLCIPIHLTPSRSRASSASSGSPTAPSKSVAAPRRPC
jgi:hypothetical protein